MNHQTFVRVFLRLLICSLLAACQPEDATDIPSATAPVESAQARSAVTALDLQTARARKQRLAEVDYAISIDLAQDPLRFTGVVAIDFDLSDPAPAAQADLTVDFGGGNVLDVLLNGSPADCAYNGAFLTLPAASLRGGANTAIIRFNHPYSQDGTGLHRFVDPVDGLAYLYTYLWPYYANRLFPSFDQPNLKARFTLSVRAPRDWIVVSTAPGQAGPPDADGTATWHFPATPDMSTYAFSLHAGPYHVWEADADGVPMRLMARQSLADFVAVDEWFDVSRRGLRYYSEYFDIPYPFAKYDQLIVPDFNIGAMENIAAVTFAEHYVQRQPSDRGERERRQSVILHEMAHMWFGNLVTHDWWNGLWLNESFATQMAAMAEIETTEFSDSWHGFFTDAKQKAYRADSRVSTHPIEVPVNSTADFFSVFDDITYQKGSSVLKQLAHYVGEENYRRGVADYLQAHAYGTTRLDDFIAFQAATSGKDIAAWARDWLYQSGFNTLQAVPSCENGQLIALHITQSAPAGHATLRQHQVEVALYALNGNGGLQPATVIPATISGADSTVVLPNALPCPALVNPNHQDWTLARIELDERSLETLATQLDKVPEPLARSMFLAALLDRAMQGATPLAGYLESALRLSATESNIRVLQQISSSIVTTTDLMQRLRPETDEALAAWLPVLEEQSLRLAAADTAADLKRSWFNAFLGVTATQQGLLAVRELLDGTRDIPGLPITADMRWALLIKLAAHGTPDIDALIAAERASDDSDFGVKSALTASAARPDGAQKNAWLAELQSPEALGGLAKQRAVMAGLFPANQTQLQFELLDEVLQSLPALSHTVDPYFMSSYVRSLLQPTCLPASVARMQDTLDQQIARLDSTAVRFLREAHQADAECLELRSSQH